MAGVLASDVEALRAALAGSGGEVSVTLTLPRGSAEKVLALLDAERTTGAVVVPAKELFTTTEAATMLGLSRPTLMKLIESGEIEHVMVGTHHRIPAQAIVDFQRVRRLRRARPRRRWPSSPTRSACWIDHLGRPRRRQHPVLPHPARLLPLRR